MSGGGGFGRRASFLFSLLLFVLLPCARAAACARAIYAPAVARPGTSFWVLAQFDDEGANLSPSACAATSSADCGLFSAASSSSNGSSLVALPPLHGFPSLARASIARVRLLMPLSARAMINVTLARPACNASASTPLSVLVAPANPLPPRPPTLSIARAPSLVDATFDVRLDFPDRFAWLDPSLVLVNSSSVVAGAVAGSSSLVLPLAANGTANSTTTANSTATPTNRTRPASPPTSPPSPSLPALMALAAGARVAMATRPRGDADAAAGTALVLTVDGAAPGQMVRVQVPARAFAGPAAVLGATTTSNSSVLAVRVPGPSSLLPGLAVLSARLLPSALGVSAGVCAAAAMLAPGSYVATVTCGSGGLLRSVGHAQAAAALGAALSSPAFGLAPSVATAANGLRWSMLQWLPAAFNDPFATCLARWAMDVEEGRKEKRALRLEAAMGPLAAQEALAREAEALRVMPVAAVTRSGLWRETIGAAPLEMIAVDGLVRDIAVAEAPPPSPPAAPSTTSALADADTAAKLDAWLSDMQLGGQQGNSSTSNSTVSGSGVLSFAVAPLPSEDERAAFLAPRALASRQALPAGAWVLEPDTPEGERRRGTLEAAWVAFLGAAEVAGAAMLGACLLHAASAAASTGAGEGGTASSQQQPSPPSPPQPQQPPPSLLPPPPRILASLPVGPERRRRDPNLARRAIRNNAMLVMAAAAEEEESATGRNDQQQQADVPPPPPPLPSPPFFVWPKLVLLVAVASWPPLVHLSCGLLPAGAPGWMVAATAGPLAALGLAAAAWMLLWSTRRGIRGLLQPSVLLDAQATSEMVDEDAARCRELEQEDGEDAAAAAEAEEEEEEEEEERRRRDHHHRPPSSLRPPEPSFSARMTTCTITEIRQQQQHSSTLVSFAARPSNGRGQLTLVQSPPPSPSPLPPPRSRSPSPVAERLLPFVPPIYYTPMVSASSSPANTTAVTLLRPVLLLPPPQPRETTATPPPPEPSRSPALLQSVAPRQERRRVRRAVGGVEDENDEDEDAMELASVAAAAAASARFVASTGIVPPAPPAPLPLLLRAQGGGQQDDGLNTTATARQAADALLQVRLVAYAGAAGPLLADVVGPVVVASAADDDNAQQQQQQQERALQSRAAPAFLGANALAFTGTLLVCGLAGLLGATSARPPLDAVGAAASAVVGVGPASFASSSGLVTAGVWVLLPLRVVWAVFATQAYASASAAIFEAVCPACEVGLLIVAAVAVPVLRGSWPGDDGRGGSGSPQARAALTVAALIFLLVMMIFLTIGEGLRALIVIFEAGGVRCWGGRRRGGRGAVAPGAPLPSPSASSARVAPQRRRPF